MIFLLQNHFKIYPWKKRASNSKNLKDIILVDALGSLLNLVFSFKSLDSHTHFVCWIFIHYKSFRNVWYFIGKIDDNFILKKIQIMKIRVLCTFVVFAILSISSLASTIDTNPHPTPLLMKFSMKYIWNYMWHFSKVLQNTNLFNIVFWLITVELLGELNFLIFIPIYDFLQLICACVNIVSLSPSL